MLGCLLTQLLTVDSRGDAAVTKSFTNAPALSRADRDAPAFLRMAADSLVSFKAAGIRNT